MMAVIAARRISRIREAARSVRVPRDSGPPVINPMLTPASIAKSVEERPSNIHIHVPPDAAGSLSAPTASPRATSTPTIRSRRSVPPRDATHRSYYGG
jgi:hypothetical protein